MIDLRSDTVTTPTPKMREAMAKAIVGDDVYGEDPTVNELETYAAGLLQKESALFVPSGTMGNLIAILTHCNRGDEMITGSLSHTFLYEAGGMAALGGVQPHTLPNQADGTIKLEEIRDAIREEDVHYPMTRLIALENTHNRCGGVVLPPDYIHQVSELAKEKDLLMHLDGARVFNAAVALNLPVAELVSEFDSVTFCLSKALCAPVGSVLCGTTSFIKKARRIRKQLGGGMRQAGILAAAGLIALKEMVPGLAEDHRRAKTLAQGLAEINGLSLRNGAPQTNMVFIDLDPGLGFNSVQLIDSLKKFGILAGASGNFGLRLVTHFGIDDQDVKKVIEGFGLSLKP